MPIDFDNGSIFPNNVVQLVAARFAMEDDRLIVLKRPLRTQDLNFSIGVWADNWLPTPNSQEMMGVDFARSPTLEMYSIMVQGFVRHSDEIIGLSWHAVLAETLRTILGSDPPLRQQLGGLTATLNGTIKRLKRFWVRAGRYRNNQVNGENLYLCTNDLMLEVEKVNA